MMDTNKENIEAKKNSEQLPGPYSYSLRPKKVDFDETWKRVESTIKRIMNLQPLDRRVWDYNFSDIYSLCVAIPEPLSDKLYQKTQAFLTEHVRGIFMQVKKVPEYELMSEYCKLWTRFSKGAHCIHNLFGYLNKQYVKIKRCSETEVSLGSLVAYNSCFMCHDLKEIGMLALQIWKENLLEPITNNLVGQLLTAIADDRAGKSTVPVYVVRNVISSFAQADGLEDFHERLRGEKHESAVVKRETYEAIFEQKYLQNTQEYYTILADKLLAKYDIAEYMAKVTEHLKDEEGRSQRFLPAQSHEKVARLCQDAMVTTHKDSLYGVCRNYIENNRTAELCNMYKLLKPVNGGLYLLMKEFEVYVKKTGLDQVVILKSDSVPQQFVDIVLKVHARFSKMVQEVFSSDGDFASALDKALQAIVNYREEKQVPKASEWLARHIDTFLRKTARGLSDSEIDDRLSEAITIFRYIEDKDLFQKFYSKMLSNRLIFNASIAKDAEEIMITKLKQACGFEFTSKLSRMFTDMNVSTDLTEKFTESRIKENAPVSPPMHVMILQQGAWPLTPPSTPKPNPVSSQPPDFVIPRMLAPGLNQFEKFYFAAYSGRKLTWLHSLSTAEVKLTYLDKVYLVSMSVHQLAILLCFENSDVAVKSHIENETGLQEELISRNLAVMYDSGLLLQGDAGESTVKLNMQFTFKRIRYRISAPQMQRQVGEKEREHITVSAQNDRKYYMEAAIVRIMKTRKVIKHGALVQEVVEQTKGRFTPDLNFIKKNIESLIEKMYIQRTDQHDEYQYLA